MLSLHDLDPSYWIGDTARAHEFYLSSVGTIFPYNNDEVPINYFLNSNAFIGVFVQAILAETGALEEF